MDESFFQQFDHLSRTMYGVMYVQTSGVDERNLRTRFTHFFWFIFVSVNDFPRIVNNHKCWIWVKQVQQQFKSQQCTLGIVIST